MLYADGAVRPEAGYAELPAEIAGLGRSASCGGERRGAL
jgi:hypothetical protein